MCGCAKQTVGQCVESRPPLNAADQPGTCRTSNRLASPLVDRRTERVSKEPVNFSVRVAVHGALVFAEIYGAE